MNKLEITIDNYHFRYYEWIYCGLFTTGMLAFAYSTYFVHWFIDGDLITKVINNLAMFFIVLIELNYNCLITLFYLNIYLKFKDLNEHFGFENHHCFIERIHFHSIFLHLLFAAPSLFRQQNEW